MIPRHQDAHDLRVTASTRTRTLLCTDDDILIVEAVVGWRMERGPLVRYVIASVP